MTHAIERAQGSTVPIRFRIERGDAGTSLSGATVTMYLIDTQEWDGEDRDPPRYGRSEWLVTGSVKVNGAACTVDADQDANPGEVEWTPESDDLDTPGFYRMQPWVVFADGSEDAPPAVHLYVYPTIKGRA